MRQQHEQRIARRVGDTEHLRGGDVLGGVPERRGRCQREEIDAEHGERRERREQIRGSFADRCRRNGHGVWGASDGTGGGP